ncbi:MAG: DNA-binding response regulator [Betaproteobacteria bacterium HGW-Betaproteobacteria-1]|jgi:DNA-binding NarL/FixJ family response regulator|nr:MAG: DNA-binding response regulator [Betaproteobacteria bacterium HGW-Betaproteobacteria-1]
MNRLLLVDDHAVIRQGLRTLLGQAGYQIVAEAGTGEQAYIAWQKHRPSLVLLDLDMPGMGGLETLQRILAQDAMAKVLIFTMYDDTIHAARAIRAGARGYVVKSDDPDILLQAIQQILAGKRFIGHEIAQQIAVEQSSGLDNPINSLSQREFEVFSRLIAGDSLNGIASQLNISQKSTANIQTQIRQKLNVQSTSQMVHLAISYGIL